MRRTRFILPAAALALAACSLGLSRPAVERVDYLLSATRDAPAAPASKPVAIRIRPLRADALYERREFLYRVDGQRVLSDFYNEFAERPDAMITSAVVGWLKNAKLFAAVVEPGVPADAPYFLDGSVTALYGDLQDPRKPAAVMEIRFYLVRAGNASMEVVLERTLRQRVEVEAGTPQALAQGYNAALARILAELEGELAALELRK
ncbi:MAG: ABC-type transport auxiliary lipoprotein family protein [Burkholderiales bacterium]